MAFNNEIMVASGGDEQHPGEPTIENIPGGGSQGGVTGVKGNAESTYRDGNVNITQDNIVDDTSTNDISDSDVFITKEGNTWYKKTFSKVWDCIKSKIKSVLHVDTGTIDDIVNVYGSKNFISIDIEKTRRANTNGTWSGNSYTIYGITFTINADGTVTANGTASDLAGLWLIPRGQKALILPVGDYRVTSTPSDGSNAKYLTELTYTTSDNTGRLIGHEYGSGYNFSITSSMISTYFDIGVNLYVRNGQTVSNILFKPMIRCASIQDDTYEPYAKTNKQLTDDTSKSELLNLLHPVGTIIESTTCDTMAKVVAAYGGTTWKQHTGYVLRGASSGVVANSNVKTGGSDDAIVVAHTHTTPNHSHTFTGTAANYNSGGITANHYHGFTSNTGGEHWHFVASPSGHTWSANFGGGTRATTFGFTPSSVNGNSGYGDHGLHAEPNSAGANSNHAHSGNTGYVSSDHVHTTTVTPYGSIGNAAPTTNSTGSAGTNANIPNYKSVYIWERTA